MFRGTALRVFLAVLIGLMSVSFGTAMAEESGDPASEIETTTTTTTTTDESTDTDSTDDGSTLPSDEVETETDTTSDVETDTTSESDGSTDGETDGSELTPETGEGETTTDSTEDAATDDTEVPVNSPSNMRSISPMALTPDGQMIAPDDLGISVPEGRQFKDLANVSVTLDDIAEGTCTGGSPRFAIGLSSEDDGTTDGYAFAYIANSANSFVGCDTSYATGANLVGTSDAQWETVQVVPGSTMYMPWSDAVTNVGDYYVTEAMLVLDVAPGSLTPTNISVAFTVAGDPGALLGKLAINFSVTGGTPAGNVCFDVVNNNDPETVVAHKCFDTANLVEDEGSLAVDRLAAGDYTVTQSTTPEGFNTPEPVSITINAGQNHNVQFDSEFIVTESTVTINLSSKDAAVTKQMPAGSTWSVTDGTQTFGDTFDPAHLKLPVTIPVNSPLPVGDYMVTIHAEPTFATYTGTVTLNKVTQTVEIALVPAAQSEVTISLSSADTAVKQLPSGSKWTVTSVANPDFTFSDTFAEQDLALPQNIKVVHSVPYGEYTVTVDAGPTFVKKTMTVTIGEPTQTVSVELVPVSLVDEIVAILIQILSDILEETAA